MAAPEPDDSPPIWHPTEFIRVRGGNVVGMPQIVRDPRRLQIGPDSAQPSNSYHLPVELDDPPFNPITQVKTGPRYTVLPDRVVISYDVRPKTAGEAQSMKAQKVERVHQLGDAKLNAQVSARQQVQALARLVQLLYAHTDTSTWPPQHRQLVAALGNRLASVQGIRDVEDTKVTELNALPDDPAVINAYDENTGW